MPASTSSPLRRRHRRLATIATALAATLALSGCTLVTTLAGARGGTDGYGGDDDGTGLYDDSLDAALVPYYEQDLSWSSCHSDFECATASAPMDWSDPSKGDIELAMMKLPATGKAIGTLFINPGGPGASGIGLVEYADYIFGSSVLRNYDIVGWDPRGVGASSAVSCFGSDEELDAWIYPEPDPAEATMTDEQIIQAATESAKAFGEACLEHTGPLLEFVDTQSTVHDLDMMRAAVGDPQLAYLGFSYGTQIGAEYIDRFPKRAGRMVLDGAVDVSLDSFDMSIQQMAGFAGATRNYMTDCMSSAQCPFTGSVDAGITQMRDIMLGADTSHPKNPDGRTLTSAVVSRAIIQTMYSERLWSTLTDAFVAFKKSGDTRGFFELSDQYWGRQSDGSYEDNSTEAFLAISCLDAPVETDPGKIVQFNRDYAAANPLALPGPEALGDVTCQEWPFKSRVTPGPVTGAGAAPVLVVGTTGDPATPYSWAQSLAEQLESATLVTYEGEGHTAYGNDPCINGIIDDYLVDGTVPASPPTC